MSISDFVTSWIRTAVPAGVAFFLTWLATDLDVVLDGTESAGVTAAAVAVVTAVYYALARLLESRIPALGVLLGSTRQPAYAKGDHVEGPH